MIEAKDKEQAVLHLHRMYDLHPVIYGALSSPFTHSPVSLITTLTESLRPPAEVETTQTKGRKSHKPAGTGAGEHAELGPAAKAEEHAVSSAKKKRAPKKDDTKPVVEKKKRAPRKAKAEPVDPVLAELPAAPETTDVPMLDADAEHEPEPASTKKRAPRKTKAKVEPVAQDLADEPMGEPADKPSPAKKRKTTRKGTAPAVAIDAGDADAEGDALPAVRPRTKRTASGKPKAAH
jgi:hypothetical protein